jgi:Domain of unknown function (DUF4902)
LVEHLTGSIMENELFWLNELADRDDYYLRFSEDMFERIELKPLTTVLEPDLLHSDPVWRECHGCCAGSAEWYATLNGKVASVSWDWLLLNDSEIRILNSDRVRTNLMLISPTGEDLGQEKTAAAIQKLLRTIPWKPVVLESVQNKT